LCTASNLLLGVTAIAAVTNQNFRLSAILIVLAALLDRADGILARRCNAVSAFGKEFDSLADLVSFGVAPSVLLYNTLMGNWNAAALACFALFTLCGAFRLARFNVSSNPSSFQGVPITIAGSVLAVLAVLIPNSTVILAAGFILSLAMISTIRIPKI
jgi:CDP-diacylglycerol--serine O-phosphatidyltransferase